VDTALQCLVLVARQHGVELSVDRIKREHAIQEAEVTEGLLIDIVRQAGLDGKSMAISWADLMNAGEALPCIARLKNGFSVVVVKFRVSDEGTEEVMVLDPLSAQVELVAVPKDKFSTSWSGRVTWLKRSRDHQSEAQEEFGLGWFVDEIGRMKGIFGQVALIALLLHIFAFVPAIFSMIIFDKVVTFHSEDTLHVLFAGVLMALLFNGVLGYLRSLLLLHATSKLDVRAAGFSFRRLLSLPLSLFQGSPAGVLVKHMQQTSSVREFFTGSLLLTLIELTALLLLLPVLAFLSPELTGIVLLFSVVIALNSYYSARPYKARIAKLYEVEGNKQALLVETINGMETVKTLALEPFQLRNWLDRSAQAVRMQFEVGKVSTMTAEVSGLLMKVMSVTVIWAGTLMVFNGRLSVGVLIAFNMLAMRVTGPLVQLVTLINKYQQTALSVRMLSGLLNRRQERDRKAGISPEISGGIEFDRVSFRYSADGASVLDSVNLKIHPGQTVGVVGRSGSGKSTLVRLLQGLHSPNSGVLRIDGHDIREFDLMHLRTQVGVVLQKSFLFKGTVRENIAIARPEASLEDVIEAARLSGSERFIEEMAQSYETVIEEDGANLSGGQKQRLALARALLMRPKILVLDEATSALDPESEAIIRDNFSRIAASRTVINISHRLSNLTDLDTIVVVDAGRVVDMGPHLELLQRCELYQSLWFTQNPHLRA
jgi:subfamily B ATP-binding cassette protein HlyB/CyaB